MIHHKNSPSLPCDTVLFSMLHYLFFFRIICLFLLRDAFMQDFGVKKRIGVEKMVNLLLDFELKKQMGVEELLNLLLDF